MHKHARELLVVVLAFAPRLASGQSPSFHVLDSPPESAFNQATAVTDDGSQVIGYAINPEWDNYEAVVWDVSANTHSFLGALPPPSSISHSFAQAATPTGDVVVGHATMGGAKEAIRWTTSGMERLGFLHGGTHSMAHGVSADGTKVVGWSTTVASTFAFLWTPDAPMVSLGELPGGGTGSWALSISDDGSTIAGQSESALGLEAFMWTAEAGMVGLGAGSLAGGVHLTERFAVSQDGSFIAGTSNDSAYVWSAQSGLRPIAESAWATGINQDGTVAIGTPVGNGSGFVWDRIHGSRSVVTLLRDGLGLDLQGLRSLRPYDLSADGTVITGTGIDEQYDTKVWVAFIPVLAPPGDIGGDTLVNIDDLFAVIAGWGPCPDSHTLDPCPADMDRNAVVDIDDLFIVLTNWS